MAKPAQAMANLARGVLGAGIFIAVAGCGAGSPTGVSGAPEVSEAPPSPPPVPIEAFDATRAWRDLERICGFGERPAGSSGIEKLRVFLEEELTKIGLQPVRESFTAETPRGPVSFSNLVADLPGPEGVDPICILSAHIDTKWGMPFRFVGANDGGSQTTVLLELARQLAAHRDKLRIGYRFVFFDGEEAVRPNWEGEDNCYGSRHHVKELQKSGLATRIKACVLLDMVGDADLKLTMEQNSEMMLMASFLGAASRIGLEQHIGGRAMALLDDHIPFREAGIPAVNLIDFDFGPNNSYWHTADDTLDKCSRESLQAIGRIVLAGLPNVEDLVLDERRPAR